MKDLKRYAAIILILFATVTITAQTYEHRGQDVSLLKEQISTDLTIPKSINFQGYLYRDGNPMDTTMDMWFGIYADPTGGSTLFEQTKMSITVANGWFTVTLDNISNSVFPVSGPNRYLEVKAPATGPALTPRISLVSVGYSYHALSADTAEYARSGAFDNAWIRGTPDSVLYTIRQLGIARGGTDNTLYGTKRYTHVNLGTACTTGTSGQNHDYCTVSGGYSNLATIMQATVGGGVYNTASGGGATVSGGGANEATNLYTTVSGGEANQATNDHATVSGGDWNTASEIMTTIGGGYHNIASGSYATISGGNDNIANNNHATVGGGSYNTASNDATVGGGNQNTASGVYATVSGGQYNRAGATYSTVAGGLGDTSAASYSFTVGYHSIVPSSYSYSAAFNGTSATASNQLRCDILANNSDLFAIDHPLDPTGKILNHYSVSSPEMVLVYRGTATIGADGRAEVHLPDYFDALNEKPMVQLTGIGSSDVYVMEKVNGNRFVIGGKPGIEVYWTVTGARKDQSAEITKIVLPVEQSKTGALAGRSLDDDFLVSSLKQLEQMGYGNKFNFRTANGRVRYEEMGRTLREAEQENKIKNLR